jgi:hypothetical protein
VAACASGDSLGSGDAVLSVLSALSALSLAPGVGIPQSLWAAAETSAPWSAPVTLWSLATDDTYWPWFLTSAGHGGSDTNVAGVADVVPSAPGSADSLGSGDSVASPLGEAEALVVPSVACVVVGLGLDAATWVIVAAPVPPTATAASATAATLAWDARTVARRLSMGTSRSVRER